ncbi:MAG: LrgB family protein [Mycobacterium leprae]
MTGLLLLAATILIYFGAKKLYRRTRSVLLSPLLTVPLLLVGLLLLLRLPYATYMSGGQWLSDLLGPATVALAIPIHKNMKLLKQHALEITCAIGAGAVLALVSSFLLAFWLHLGLQIADSMAPRSVTTPIAMAISRSLGGDPTLTAVFVIVTALVGLVAGPLLIRSMPIKSPVARGLLFGVGAHGAGTARAFEFGELEGTFSSLAMVLTAGATLVLTPLLLPHMQSLFK